ncbi:MULTISPECIES: hypothetical protein [Mesorhizobium]|uniref:Uncharacterized protein n=1 Tax=Mesorhizobium salmacidum TaxID=3015171 RepID=A0ABU8L1C5_9HYPH
MNIKMICLGAMALSMVTGSALAGSSKGTSALDDPAKMKPFYTDSGMKTMVSNDAFTRAWKALTPEDQTAMRTACADEVKNANPTNTHPEFCSSVKLIGGS